MLHMTQSNLQGPSAVLTEAIITDWIHICIWVLCHTDLLHTTVHLRRGIVHEASAAHIGVDILQRMLATEHPLSQQFKAITLLMIDAHARVA